MHIDLSDAIVLVEATIWGSANPGRQWNRAAFIAAAALHVPSYMFIICSCICRESSHPREVALPGDAAGNL